MALWIMMMLDGQIQCSIAALSDSRIHFLDSYARTRSVLEPSQRPCTFMSEQNQRRSASLLHPNFVNH